MQLGPSGLPAWHTQIGSIPFSMHGRFQQFSPDERTLLLLALHRFPALSVATDLKTKLMEEILTTADIHRSDK